MPDSSDRGGSLETSFVLETGEAPRAAAEDYDDPEFADEAEHELDHSKAEQTRLVEVKKQPETDPGHMIPKLNGTGATNDTKYSKNNSDVDDGGGEDVTNRKRKPAEMMNSSEPEVAISLRRAYKHYGRGRRQVPVLTGLNMTIPKGSIYGLLGPSGCGKTTLLQCIVGKQRLKSGQVVVFGGPPGSVEAGVPGARVGYMPQELALYKEFTIAETLQYFGRVFNLTTEKIKERTTFLLEFLDLPTGNRLICNLSGGQQRRASLAAALLHEPELLILDEPTVGVDPLLRQCIWSHLVDISKSSKLQTTIVITTHYIEEARQAHVVGMMRFGRLLAEGPPTDLIETYQRETLEDVFLHLCLGDEDSDRDAADPNTAVQPNDLSCMEKGSRNVFGQSTVTPESNGHSKTDSLRAIEDCEKKSALAKLGKAASSDKKSAKSAGVGGGSKGKGGAGDADYPWCEFLRFHRLKAIVMKNFIRMWRNIGFLLFQFILPTVQVALFCLAIGRDPRGLTVAVVNEEIPSTACLQHSEGCILGQKDDFFGNFDFSTDHRYNLSCRFLSYLDPDIIKPDYYDTMEEAVHSVKMGDNWGVMHFKKNFSGALFERMFGLMQLKTPDNETMDSSEIHVHQDMTNQQIAYTIQLRLTEAYLSFSQGLLDSCSLPPKLASLPIVFEKPVYGKEDPTFTEFMAPGVILSITYFMAVGLTALSFILDRKEGLLDRSWVAGVTATEVMLAHVIAQFVVMVVQVALVLVFMIYVFEVPAEGPMIWIVLLTILQGICGMAFGLVISALCDNEQDAIQLALGSFYPNLLLSGIIWPLEGMPMGLRYISYFLPQTYACIAMRGILSRGWGLEWMQVYRGYLVTIAWTVGLLILSAVILKIRR